VTVGSDVGTLFKMMLEFNSRASFVKMASRTTEQTVFIVRVALLFRKCRNAHKLPTF
jgi:hypothetical protein